MELALEIKKSKTIQIDNDASNDGDVHSKRFFETSKLTEREDSYSSLRGQMHRFILDIPSNTLKLNLDEINVINIENEETFHRTPKLAHSLELVL